MSKRWESCDVDIDGAVATVTIIPPAEAPGDLHWEFGEVLGELRGDTSVRVIVLTARGEEFFVLPRRTRDDPTGWRRHSTPEHAWKTFTGIVRIHELMAAIEKPIVARVNGNATWFGCSLALACDLIVAVEDAVFIDGHLGMGDHPYGGPDYGMVPGDGGCALVPLALSPAKAKEFLMLSKPYSAVEFVEEGVINYAVPRDQLDAKTEEIVAALLRRSPYALAWTKRTANRHVAAQVGATIDAGVAYEMLNFQHLNRAGAEPTGIG